MKIGTKHYFLICLAIISILVSSFGYWFVYDAVIKQAENYSESSKEEQIEKDNSQKAQELVKIHTDTKDDRAKLPTFAVSEDKVVDFIESVESIGAFTSTKVELSSINNENSFLKAHVQASGNWSDLLNSLVMIENIPYSVSLNNVQFTSFPDKKGQWNMSLDIQALMIK